MPWLVLETLLRPMSHFGWLCGILCTFVLPILTSSHLNPKVRVGMVLTFAQDDPWTGIGPLDKEVKERGVLLAMPSARFQDWPLF